MIKKRKKSQYRLNSVDCSSKRYIMPTVHFSLHYPNRYFHIFADRLSKNNNRIILSSIILTSMLLANFLWIISHMNLDGAFNIIFCCVFVIGLFIIILFSVVHVIKNLKFEMVEPQAYITNPKPTVRIIIPTYNETLNILRNTIMSVINQDWPKESMKFIVGDDGHRDELKDMINSINQKFNVDILYFRPPKSGSKIRKGDAKSGNLNSSVYHLISKFPDIELIETRDADDMVVNKLFISYCMYHLTNNSATSFVQTIKQSRVSNGDPFSNNEALFYQRGMPAKAASNALFPCGSGLIWRLSDLVKIKGFPIWNLVEDLQSGYEILRLGGKGVFMPIVGAMGQIAPEDIPNFYKQRGTWALDTIRLF